MTPQEKGDELIEKFRNELSLIEMIYPIDVWREARKCAIIAVEEIIKVMDSDDFYAVTINDEEKFVSVEDYWNDVLNYLKQKQ